MKAVFITPSFEYLSIQVVILKRHKPASAEETYKEQNIYTALNTNRTGSGQVLRTNSQRS